MKTHIGALVTALMAAAGVWACAGPNSSQAESWTEIEPGGETLCATGTPFRFHVRQGHADRVMIFLNGGGACWSGDLCDLSTGANPYTPFSEDDVNDPKYLSGVFEDGKRDNPFSGWTQIFVPYCTGDAHLGSGDVTYTTSAGPEAIIHHRGKANVQAALDWVYANRPSASRIFVTGGSAGAIASPYYAGLLAEHYPDADIAQLADGSGGYRTPAISGVLETWGAFEGVPAWPEFSLIDHTAASTEDFFRVTAARHPQVQLARFDHVDDQVQQDFLALLGTAEPVRKLQAANNADLVRDIPGIRIFSSRGDAHTALRQDNFYTEQAGGMRLADWVGDLAEGKDVETLSCETDASCD